MGSKNLHLGYVGGSGGFLTLHLLLLTNSYVNNLSNDLPSILERHWNVTDHNKWKDSEVWPNNATTKLMPNDQKLFFYLSPTVELWQSITEPKLLVYTDFRSQLLLSKFKKAWMYYEKNNNTIVRDMDHHFRNFYQNIKDMSWPDCDTIEQSKALPTAIQNEMLTHIDYQNFLTAHSWEDWTVIANQHCKLNNDVVESTVPALAANSNYVVKLQNIVNSNAHALLDPLALPVLSAHIALLEKWKSLHTKELLQQIGINCSN